METLVSVAMCEDDNRLEPCADVCNLVQNMDSNLRKRFNLYPMASTRHVDVLMKLRRDGTEDIRLEPCAYVCKLFQSMDANLRRQFNLYPISVESTSYL